LAGLGRKIFNSGDILLASEVQGYLQDQAVMVFDDSATRATAIGTANFSEGMASYLKDTDQVEVYNGTAWASVGSEPGLVHINSTSFSAVANQTVNDVFTSAHKNYLLVARFSKSTAAAEVILQYTISGTPTTTNYVRSGFFVNSAASSGSFFASTGSDSIVISNTGDNNAFRIEVYQPQVSGITWHTGIISAESQATFIGGRQNATNSFDGFKLSVTSGNITGYITTYALKD
jgi:hypothetical protein